MAEIFFCLVLFRCNRGMGSGVQIASGSGGQDSASPTVTTLSGGLRRTRSPMDGGSIAHWRAVSERGLGWIQPVLVNAADLTSGGGQDQGICGAVVQAHCERALF